MLVSSNWAGLVSETQKESRKVELGVYMQPAISTKNEAQNGDSKMQGGPKSVRRSLARAGVPIGRAIACQWLRFYQHHALRRAVPCAGFHSGQLLPRRHPFLRDLGISDYDKNPERR